MSESKTFVHYTKIFVAWYSSEILSVCFVKPCSALRQHLMYYDIHYPIEWNMRVSFAKTMIFPEKSNHLNVHYLSSNFKKMLGIFWVTSLMDLWLESQVISVQVIPHLLSMNPWHFKDSNQSTWKRKVSSIYSSSISIKVAQVLDGLLHSFILRNSLLYPTTVSISTSCVIWHVQDIQVISTWFEAFGLNFFKKC